MDSGAAGSVAPPSTCPTFFLMESQVHEQGRNTEKLVAYLKTEGESKVQAWTEEGCPVGMTWRGAEVTKPPNSLSKMCDAGNVVTFTAH